MVQHGCTHVFMEVSSHALDQNRVAGISFDIGVFTNISRDHMDYHPTINHYIGSKKKLFKALKKNAFAIINKDDTYGEEMGRDLSAKVLYYGLKESANYLGKVIENNISGIKKVFSAYLNYGDKPDDALMINNDEWLSSLNYLEFLRDVGRHFSVNRMLSFESVKSRLDREQSLSFLEFNYMILQAYDFYELNKRYGC